jgi:CDP-glycerol glycerophosphotransferase (TagB/SpsB family)
LQTVKDTELLEWVCSQAKYNKKRLFILMPRDNRIDYSKHIKLDNCILLPEHNIYQVLKYSDYNITIYSTTAVEASLFNVKTLFYNLDNLSAKYFDVNTLNASLIEEDQDIQDEHLNTIDSGIEPYFISGYHKNVENTILTF